MKEFEEAKKPFFLKNKRGDKIILIKCRPSSISFLLTVMEQMFLILAVIGGPVVLQHCGGEGGKDFIVEEGESSLEQPPPAARGK